MDLVVKAHILHHQAADVFSQQFDQVNIERLEIFNQAEFATQLSTTKVIKGGLRAAQHLKECHELGRMLFKTGIKLPAE